MKKKLFCVVVGLAIMAGNYLGAAEDCPAPPPPPPPNGPGGGANDPVFFYTEAKPKQSERVRLAELHRQVSAKVAVSGEREQAALARYEEARKAKADGVMDVVNGIWAEAVSPELKQYVLVASLPAVKSTGEVERLRFMLEAMKDPAAQKTEIARLAKGNGLEKAKAARMMEILSKNPQIKL